MMALIASLIRFCSPISIFGKYFRATHERVSLKGHLKHTKKIMCIEIMWKPVCFTLIAVNSILKFTMFFSRHYHGQCPLDMKCISTKSCVANLVCQFEAFLGISFGAHIWHQRASAIDCAISSVAIWMQATTTRALERTRHTAWLSLALLRHKRIQSTFTKIEIAFYCVYHIVYVVAASL